MTVRQVHLRIRGLVQGVSFRASAQMEARRLGLYGWVRNLSNGEVETVAQGASPAIDAYRAWCQRGPNEARVEGVEELSTPLTQEWSDFTVRR